MKHKHIFIIFSFMLLTALVACGPIHAPATLAPEPLGAGQININPGGPIQLATTPIPTPYYTPATSCVQFGCAYPAVCDQTTGQCVINNSGPATLAPVAKAPGGVPPVAINPGNINPITINPYPTPVASVNSVNSFCANQSLSLGGATFTTTIGGDAFVNADYETSEKVTCTVDRTQTPWKWSCFGPQGTNHTFQVCQYLMETSGFGNQTEGVDYVAINQTTNPSKYWNFCPAGTHWDNNLQNCADNTTNQVAPICPANFPYYTPEGLCWKNKQPEPVMTCQTFSIPLGACSVPIKKVPSCTTNPDTGLLTCK